MAAYLKALQMKKGTDKFDEEKGEELGDGESEGEGGEAKKKEKKEESSVE